MYRYRYAVDTFLMLCSPNKFPVYSCFTKTIRRGGERQCYLDNKSKMFFNVSYHVVSELIITELCLLLYLLNQHIFANKRDSLSQ